MITASEALKQIVGLAPYDGDGDAGMLFRRISAIANSALGGSVEDEIRADECRQLIALLTCSESLYGLSPSVLDLIRRRADSYEQAAAK